jgi:hypothetical protein
VLPAIDGRRSRLKDVTDAPEAPAEADETSPTEAETDAQTEAKIASFRRQLEGQVSVPASVVQDCLLDLWGSLPEGETRSEVERWLTETLERNLYAVTDVDARLSNVIGG